VQLSPPLDWVVCGSLISITERRAVYEEYSRTRLGEFSERLRSRLMLNTFVLGVDYVQAVRRCGSCTPQWPGSMWCWPRSCWSRRRRLFEKRRSLSPAIRDLSVPGFGASGLRAAIQLVGRPFHESTLFPAANAFGKAAPFHDQCSAPVAV
jgi:aspartyl-tRNA(Asn)/glutamyl-tRNA(Gln) amidotransferase subunit A